MASCPACGAEYPPRVRKCRECGAPRRPVAEVIGDAEERRPDEPVVPLPPEPPGLAHGLLDGLLGDRPVDVRSPLLVRIVRGDWLSAALTALPAVAVTVLAVLGVVLSLLVADEPGNDDALVDDFAGGRWLRYACAGVGMVFGASFSVESRGLSGEGYDSSGLSLLPLTVALLALGVVWYGSRRGRDDADPVPAAVRTAAVFAAGIAGIAAFGRWEEANRTSLDPFEEATDAVSTHSVAAFEALFWAFAAALVVGYLARRPPRLPDGWGLAVRGALVGLGTGIVASFATLVALAYANAHRADATAADVTNGLPTALGYAVNLGTAGLAVAMGGGVSSPMGEGGHETLSLWTEWVPDGYFLALLIPLVAVAAGAAYIVRYGGVTAAEAARACQRMALPAALGWWLLALTGAAHWDIEVFIVAGRLRYGAVLWDALLVAVWFGLGGWVFGHLLTRRAFDPVVDAPVP